MLVNTLDLGSLNCFTLDQRLEFNIFLKHFIEFWVCFYFHLYDDTCGTVQELEYDTRRGPIIMNYLSNALEMEHV
jgi:hypothetical protein